MAAVAWGLYSLGCRGAGDPVAHTAANLARAVPFAVVLDLILMPRIEISAGAGARSLGGPSPPWERGGP